MKLQTTIKNLPKEGDLMKGNYKTIMEHLKKYQEYKTELNNLYSQKRWVKESTDKIDEKIDILEVKVNLIQDVILDEPDPLKRQILELKYIQGKTWVQIEDITNYSTPHLLRLRTAALRDFYKRGFLARIENTIGCLSQ